jgi:hypothetical protein
MSHVMPWWPLWGIGSTWSSSEKDDKESSSLEKDDSESLPTPYRSWRMDFPNSSPNWLPPALMRTMLLLCDGLPFPRKPCFFESAKLHLMNVDLGGVDAPRTASSSPSPKPNPLNPLLL